MSVSKRLRYEVLRRDGHACRYCGASAPDAVLTLDHVVPVALGGEDTPNNLVTACRECNSGKTSISPDSPLVEDVNLDAVRWMQAMHVAGDLAATQVQERMEYVDAFDDRWGRWRYQDGDLVSRPGEWRSTVNRWHDAGLPLVVLLDLVDDVLPRPIPDGRMWPYFCGAVRRTIDNLAATARQAIEAGVVK